MALRLPAGQDGHVSDPWGVESAPAVLPDVLPPLPPRLARLAEVASGTVGWDEVDPHEVSFPNAAELPEVQALAADGWRPLDDAPLYSLLPAAWPDEHRIWIPDRLPRIAIRGATTGSYHAGVVPVPDEHADDVYEHIDDAAVAAGLPKPPRDRIWLLRSPWSQIPLVAIYELLWTTVPERTRDEIVAMYLAALDVLRWPADRALRTCPGEVRGLIEQWAAAGRAGEDAGPFVGRRLAPDDIARLTSGTGTDEETALAWLDSLCADGIDQAVDFVVAWHAAELPGEPPSDAYRYLNRDPAELRRWLDAGFDLNAAAKLKLAGLDRSIEWRAAGFSDAETYELLRSDPALTPGEAYAFTAVGIADPDRREWIYYGFTAEQAASWAAAGLTPEEARLWRATDHQPTEVGTGRRLPSELTAGRTHIFVSSHGDGRMHYPMWDDLPDPPGTRGRRARRWSHDPDPWINTD